MVEARTHSGQAIFMKVNTSVESLMEKGYTDGRTELRMKEISRME